MADLGKRDDSPLDTENDIVGNSEARAGITNNGGSKTAPRVFKTGSTLDPRLIEEAAGHPGGKLAGYLH